MATEGGENRLPEETAKATTNRPFPRNRERRNFEKKKSRFRFRSLAEPVVARSDDVESAMAWPSVPVVPYAINYALLLKFRYHGFSLKLFVLRITRITRDDRGFTNVPRYCAFHWETKLVDGRRL